MTPPSTEFLYVNLMFEATPHLQQMTSDILQCTCTFCENLTQYLFMMGNFEDVHPHGVRAHKYSG